MAKINEKNVFQFSDYKRYLVASLSFGQRRSGLRAKLAEHLGCQTAHVSQVLNGHTHFSNEQAFRINTFLGHDREESHFFFLLFNKDRAGTRDLTEYYQLQLDEIVNRRSVIKNRLNTTRVVPPEHQTRYYSSWHYVAIHMALSIPELQSKENLSEYFHLPLAVVAETLEFLVSTGLAENRSGRFVIGSSHIHLGSDANNINKHHMNWRIRAMDSLIQSHREEIHYSVVFSLSKHDVKKLQERLISVIKSNLEDVGPSQEEVLFCTCLDFFELKR